MNFMSMFGFDMADNYSERKVDNFNNGIFIVDTCLVTDGKKPYETGIKHPMYNNCRWIIVEAYDTKKEAQKGHDKWRQIMSSKDLPGYLIDCQNAYISNFIKKEDPTFKLNAN